MTRRNRTQEEHAIFEEQTSTHIQMIVSAIEASKKELIRTIKQENEETRATIRKENKETRETLWKIAEEFQEMLAETKKNEAGKSLFTYQTKPQKHLYKTDTEVLPLDGTHLVAVRGLIH